MENQNRLDALADKYADLHAHIDYLLKRGSVEQMLAELTNMYGAVEAMALFKTYRQVEKRVHEMKTT